MTIYAAVCYNKTIIGRTSQAKSSHSYPLLSKKGEFRCILGLIKPTFDRPVVSIVHKSPGADSEGVARRQMEASFPLFYRFCAVCWSQRQLLSASKYIVSCTRCHLLKLIAADVCMCVCMYESICNAPLLQPKHLRVRALGPNRKDVFCLLQISVKCR